MIGSGRVISRLKLGDLDVFGGVELFDDLFGRAVFLIQRTDERGGRDLRRLVDPHRQRVLLGDRAFDPRTALRDDPAAVQRAIAFLHFDQEVDTRRPVQLVDDHALGSR